ncbi:MAG: hypothetical protein IJ438_13525 [Clostridia bacterium]|nr:hypothetical protein [Clostridia bacterium]
MKKMLTLLLVLVMVFSVPVAIGQEYEGWDGAADMSSTVTMTIDDSLDSFIIVIPGAMTVDPLTKTGTMTVSLKAGWNLISRSSIALSLASSKNNMQLLNDAGEGVAYTLTYAGEASGTWTGNSQALFRVVGNGGNTADVSATLTITVDSLPGKGVYSDVLTFSIK